MPLSSSPSCEIPYPPPHVDPLPLPLARATMFVSAAFLAKTPLVICQSTQEKLNSTTPLLSVHETVGRLGIVVVVVVVVDVVVVVVVAPVGEPAGGEALNNEYAKRFGEPLPDPATTPAVADEVIHDATPETESDGLALSANAATPATCGDAIDVPEIVLVALFDVYQEEVIFVPGAKTSTHDP